MVRFSSLALALFGGALAAASCYSERPAPPAFRYACESESDCRSNETCIDKICQVECTQANSAEVCTGSDHLLCFNGVCTSGCLVDDEHCPSSQECIELAPLGIEIMSGGGGIFSSGASPDGLCGNFCDEDDPTSCPEGESCFGGFCVAKCEDSSTCQSIFECVEGLCIPTGGDTSGGDETAIPGTFTATMTMSGSDDGSGDTASSGDVTASATDDGATTTDGGTTGGAL